MKLQLKLNLGLVQLSHSLIFYRSVFFLYCWRNGCFFDMLELQVTKPPSNSSFNMDEISNFWTENGHF